MMIVAVLILVLATWSGGPVLAGAEVETAVTESAGSAPATAAPATRPERSAEVEALHAARQAGDMETVRAILAARPSVSPRVGESAGPVTLRTSGAVCSPGDLRLAAGDGTDTGGRTTEGRSATFGTDIRIRYTTLDDAELNPSLASIGDTLYAAFQAKYTFSSDLCIKVYRSDDGGETWGVFISVHADGADLLTPSIAIGTGITDTLVLAYIVDDGISAPYPEVATAQLDTSGIFTTHAVPHQATWEAYAKPVVWTDNPSYYTWYAYLTCEGVYDSATDNYNVCFWYSSDQGENWVEPSTGFVVVGNLDTLPWRDADGTYGTTMNRLLLTCYNEDDNTVYCLASDDFGDTWDPDNDLKAIATLDTDPTYPVDPDIETTVSNDNVMLVCTKSYEGSDNIGQTYSTDGGETWPQPLWSLNGSTDDDEFAPELVANHSGRWHLAFTRYNGFVNTRSVCYSQRPLDLSEYWQATPDVVDDMNACSIGNPKKGITGFSGSLGDKAGIAWSDYRDGAPDYDLMFDYDRVGYFGPTIDCSYDCTPESGTLPFSAQMSATLQNLYPAFTRTVAGRINVVLANGTSISNWRGGYTNIAGGDSYNATWTQNLPAVGALHGISRFLLLAEDITPAPYNQPPYPPAGDTSWAECTIVGY
jgi:hypothetical protein